MSAAWRTDLGRARLLLYVVVAAAGVGVGWVAKQGYAVHALTRGVGDTWFHTADGKRWFRLDEERHDVPISAISPHLQHAFVAVEDHRFFRHPGVDPIAVARAVVRNARAPGTVEGGSTITQQLARTLFLSNRRSYWRKGREAVLSVLIEAQLSKEQILELYLNRIYLSAGVYGVEAMSQRVFGKPSRNLSIAESALIAGLARAPAALSPWSNLDAAMARSHVVLARMREGGFIDAAEEREARRARFRVRPYRSDDVGRHGYAKGYLRQRFRDTFGGDHPPDWRVDTTFVAALQDAAEAAVERGLGRLGTRGAAGGAGRHRSAHRQRPGTGRRPRLPAIGLQPGEPQPPSARVGLQAAGLRRRPRARPVAGIDAHGTRSHPAAGPGRVDAAQRPRRRARRADAAGGAARVEQPGGDAAAAAGGITAGAGAGGAGRARGSARRSVAGARHRPGHAAGDDRRVRHVPQRRAGGAPARHHPRPGRRWQSTALRQDVEAERVLSPEVAFQMVSMLGDVVDRGTGASVRRLGVRFPVAGKTGTTDDFKDAWFVGFSPSLVAGVWVGFDQPAPIGDDAYGSRYALPIWADFMQRAARIRPPGRFERPVGLQDEPLCAITYLKPVDGCPLYTEHFKAGDQVPDRVCPLHRGTIRQRVVRAVEGWMDDLGRRIRDVFRCLPAVAH